MVAWVHRKPHSRGHTGDSPHRGDTLSTSTPQHTHMAWTETRPGSNICVACWKQDGKKIRKSTGVPIKGKDGMTAKQSAKLAQEVADKRADLLTASR